MTIAREVQVTGRVQGVFFRAWTKEHARALGVTGWVRNCADGSVKAHVEGDPPAVEQLIARLRNGPPDAEVAGVAVQNVKPEGFHRFDVARSL